MRISDFDFDHRPGGTPLTVGPVPTEGGQTVAWFFALDTDGRVAWPFRHVRQPNGELEPQRWRFGRWVSSSSLRAFMTGEDDQFVEASRLEVESWIRRHTQPWHPAIHAAHAAERAPAA